MWRAKRSWPDLFLHANHFTIATFIAHSDAGFNCLTCDASPHLWSRGGIASVAGLGARGPSGPRDGISSGMRPGNSSGRGDSPGSRTGGVISGCGLPGGMPGGGSVGVPGVDGGISGGSIGIGLTEIVCQENDNDDAERMFLVAASYSGAWQTASMLWPSGSSTKAP